MTLPPTNQTNPTQRPLLRASTTFYDRVITDWWWWELFSWTVSFLSVATIIGVLWYYDGREQPEQVVNGITLNAFIAVFAAVSKASLILPVSECIGQLKWLWFHQDAALWDFQLYDGASRGPWGSLLLLLRTRFTRLVSLGALITVLALAFEPFLQQIVNYPERSTPVGQSKTWAATTFVPEVRGVRRKLGGDDHKQDSSMNMALQIAFNSPDVDTRPSTSVCSTGNCVWPTYSTLAVCHQCQNVSYLLEYICKNHTSIADSQSPGAAKDPCGYHLNNTFIVGIAGNVAYRRTTSLSTLTVDTFQSLPEFGPFMNTTVYANATLPIADFYIGYTPGGPPAVLRNETPVLIECLLTWCVKTLESKTVNGVFEESVIDTITIAPNTREEAEYSPTVARLSPNTTFTIPNGTSQMVRNMILSNLPYSIDYKPAPGVWQFHQKAPYDFEPYLARVMQAVTNNMKSRVSGTTLVQGTALNRERFVQIRWAWITLPAASLFGSMILVCGTIWNGHKSNAPVWKSSALATLLHGLSEETRNRIDPSLSSSQIERVSKKLRVQLSSKGGDAYLATT